MNSRSASGSPMAPATAHQTEVSFMMGNRGPIRGDEIQRLPIYEAQKSNVMYQHLKPSPKGKLKFERLLK